MYCPRFFRPEWTSVLGVGLVAAFSPYPVCAQTIAGRLVVDGTARPVSGAVVWLIEGDTAAAGETDPLAEAVTTAEGGFVLEAPAAGRYRLRAERIGFATTTSQPLDVRAGETVRVELRVAREAVPVAPLMVTSDRPALVRHPRLRQWDFYERKERYGKEEGMGFAYFLEGEDLRRSAFDASDLIRDLPGVHVVPSGRRDRVIRCRGGRHMTFYLDGTAVGTGSADALDQWVAASDVVGVEVYLGMVGPLEYGGCSVVVWTGVRRERNR